MALKDDLTAVRYYTQADVYYYTVDNRPLTDLDSRNEELADELEARVMAVDITGSATPTINTAPTGWTCIANGTGDYTITHNMGSGAYIVVGNVVNATVGILFVVSKSTNSFDIKTTNSSGTATHMQFNLIVSKY